ncbi:hypothetical protein GCM10020254_01010 [Streptomyces goshikiensis]
MTARPSAPYAPRCATSWPPGTPAPTPAPGSGPPDLDRLLAIQDQAVRQAGDLVRRLARAGELTGTEQDVLGSLAHMQSNRLLGIDRTRELRSHSFRALALRAVRGRP